MQQVDLMYFHFFWNYRHDIIMHIGERGRKIVCLFCSGALFLLRNQREKKKKKEGKWTYEWLSDVLCTYLYTVMTHVLCNDTPCSRFVGSFSCHVAQQITRFFHARSLGIPPGVLPQMDTIMYSIICIVYRLRVFLLIVADSV